MLPQCAQITISPIAEASRNFNRFWQVVQVTEYVFTRMTLCRRVRSELRPQPPLSDLHCSAWRKKSRPVQVLRYGRFAADHCRLSLGRSSEHAGQPAANAGPASQLTARCRLGQARAVCLRQQADASNAKKRIVKPLDRRPRSLLFVTSRDRCAGEFGRRMQCFFAPADSIQHTGSSIMRSHGFLLAAATPPPEASFSQSADN